MEPVAPRARGSWRNLKVGARLSMEEISSVFIILSELEASLIPEVNMSIARRAIFISSWLAFVSMMAASSTAQNTKFSQARVIIEFNASAEDVGIQVFLDGDPWKKLQVFDPNDRQILAVAGTNSLRKQGLTELFFESSEPSLANLPLKDFLARFPAGRYEFEGETIEGTEVESVAVLSHVIPAGPEIVSPVSPDDDPPIVDPNDAVIEWEPVTEAIGGSGRLQITGYQVIVEQEKPLRVFSIDLPASATRVTVPADFFVKRNALHKFEVLAIEKGGNQTITEGEFLTVP